MTPNTERQAPLSAGRPGWFPLTAITAAATFALALTACGGGGSESGGTGLTASSDTVTYTGTVDGLGSIVVNGVRFSTSEATTTDSDDPTKPYSHAFARGTTVTVTGTVDDSGNGTATSIVVHGGVRGQVTAVDTANSTFTINGQVILVDSATVWDGTTTTGFGYSSLVAGTSYVEAYGVLDATTGKLTATRVVEKDQSTVEEEGYAFRGAVANLNTTAKTFDLTLRTGVVAHVTYTDDTVLPTGSTLANATGVRIKVSAEDATSLANATSGTVNVTALKTIVKRERAPEGNKAALVGAITTISSDRNTWTIGDATVDVSQSPTLDGVNLSTVTVGTFVKVQGSFTNGVLVAKSISSKQRDDQQRHLAGVKLYGVVSGSTAASGDTLASFVVQGVTVTLASGSSLSLPADGSYVEVKAQQDSATGLLMAVEIEQHNATARAFEVTGTTACATGTAADFTGTSGFTLTGPRGGVATVLASTATVEFGRNVNTSSVLTTPTCVVEVKGTLTATNTITATKVEVKARGNARTVSLR
ncbi:MAG: hypothetical protein RI907_2269 [Pseudomonadota bacterium]|jgi:hypothetical protein